MGDNAVVEEKPEWKSTPVVDGQMADLGNGYLLVSKNVDAGGGPTMTILDCSGENVKVILRGPSTGVDSGKDEIWQLYLTLLERQEVPKPCLT